MMGTMSGAQGVGYDPEMHVVRTTAFGSFLQTHFKTDALFTFLHMRTRKWVVAEWLAGQWGAFRELVLLGDDPWGTREAVHHLEQMDKASQGYETRKRQNRKTLRYFDAEQDRLDREDAVDMAEHSDFLRRQGQLIGGKYLPKHYVVNG